VEVEYEELTLEADDFRRYPPPIWSRVSEPLAAEAVIKAKARQELAEIKFDAVLVNGWDLLVAVRRLVRNVPVALALDVTPRAAARLLRAEHEEVWTRVRSRLGEVVHGWRFDRCCGDVEVFLPMTSWCAASLRADHGISRERLFVTLTPLDTGIWCPVIRPENDKPVVLWVGNDFRRKGGPLLLELFREGLSRHCRLRLVSNDPEVGELATTPGVEILRGLQRASLIPIYQSSDMFVLPTRRDYAGHVFAEACATGLACVGTDVGGVADLVRDGWNGYVVPFSAPPSVWAEHIRRLSDDVTLRRRLGRNGRAFAEERLGMPRFAGLLRDVLGRLASRRQDARA
jgi:glycosyltransferase involved in cell wall biosynthesis